MKKIIIVKRIIIVLISISLLVLILGDGIAQEIESSANIDLITVGDAGNISDNQGLGSVENSFQIGKYPVTAAQYACFLNAVASKSDDHGLYHSEMESDLQVASINRLINTNEDGSTSYSYQVVPQRALLPITYVTLYDAERFCNWLENGAPLVDDGNGSLKASTESGTYLFETNNNEVFVTINRDAIYHIPSQNEWVKAAYYKGKGVNSSYWIYPTAHDTAPNNGIGDITNQANYKTYSGRLSSNFLNKDLMITTVNRFSNTVSSYGVCGMGGNVAEWTSSEQLLSLTNATVANIVRGGSWESEYSWYYNNDLMRTAIPKAYAASETENFIGFRIAVGNISSLLDHSLLGEVPCPTSSQRFLSACLTFLTNNYLLFVGVVLPLLALLFAEVLIPALFSLGVECTAFGVEIITGLLEGRVWTEVLGNILERNRMICNAIYITLSSILNAAKYEDSNMSDYVNADILRGKETTSDTSTSYAKAFLSKGMPIFCMMVAISLCIALGEVGVSSTVLPPKPLFSCLSLSTLEETGGAITTASEESSLTMGESFRKSLNQTFTLRRWGTNFLYTAVTAGLNTIRDLKREGYGDPMGDFFRMYF